MVTTNNIFNSYIGMSTDTKPTGVDNGSSFLEIDTATMYRYDASNSEWDERNPRTLHKSHMRASEYYWNKLFATSDDSDDDDTPA